MKMQHHAEAYARFFETLQPNTPIETYANYFEADVFFEDPFQNVKGIEALYGIFTDMFNHFIDPRFSVDETVCHGHVAYLRWEFSCRRTSKGGLIRFEGVSRIQLSSRGLVTSHIDYWDAAKGVYETLPIIGSALRYLRSRIAAA